MPTISPEQVGAKVQAFWNAFCNRSGHLLEPMYFPSAIVFGTSTRRSEPAQLMLPRVIRKFGNRQSSMTAEPGPIDVQVAGDIAVASYPYHFHLFKTKSDGSRLDLDVPYSRGTQVFQADQNGALRILHEHLSAAEPGKSVVVPRESPSATQPAGQKPGPAPARLQVMDTGSFPAGDPIQADEVRTAVQRCWEALRSKSKDRLEEFYFPTAIFFAADGRRSEPARLAIVRRAREFFGAASSVRAGLDPIAVHIDWPEAAIV